MSNFAELGLSEAALAAVERLGYDAPTPVQEQAIPLVLEGRDLIAAASTGTGKTAAFLLPTLSTLPRGKRGKRAPRVLVVSPTRELAQQIAKTAMQISRKTGHFVTTVFGGTPYGPQINEIRRGTDVLIATPGRLNDLMEKGVVDLSSITTLVLDEADRMLDMGFLPAVTTIVDATPDNRQTLLFSATIDQSIEKNLGSLLKDPAVVEIARKGETAKTVAQYIMPIKNFNKPELLEAVLREKGSERIIVFARTKFRTEECAETLCRAGFSAESIHSDKSQGQRKRALENFRRGKTSILVATDVLARGIDVPDVDHVINFDLPDMPEDYVHRIGRTGRAGEEGYAISFVTRESNRTLKDIEKLIGKELPLMDLESYNLDPSLLKGGAKGKGGPRKSGGYKGSKPKAAYQGSRDNRPSAHKGPRPERSQDSRPGRATRSEGPSKNYSNAAKRVTSSKKGAPAQSGAKKRSNRPNTYDYSRFAKADRSA
ncbi:DEAD/DEAH box helicase [Arabiibacter massiliensis]|uniref:DEAD/DEAH box helicase n=1 Tax=Arabiibacter massiliensis TaxID=1870985 RepID=UPI0009B934F0|nr:DEAD/DEAH box helicase [Arabiibacter massiliensis]